MAAARRAHATLQIQPLDIPGVATDSRGMQLTFQPAAGALLRGDVALLVVDVGPDVTCRCPHRLLDSLRSARQRQSCRQRPPVGRQLRPRGVCKQGERCCMPKPGQLGYLTWVDCDTGDAVRRQLQV